MFLLSVAMYEKKQIKNILSRKNYAAVVIVSRCRIFFVPSRHNYRTMRFLLAIIGSVSLALGIMGIFLPVLPTTPFLLLSAALYMRSSQRLYEWLMSHKHLGPYIKNFREHKALPLRVKIVSVTMVWATLLYCAFVVAKEWWMSAMFIAIATGVTIHILSYKTLKKRM